MTSPRSLSLAFMALLAVLAAPAPAAPFTIEQALSAPFAAGLVADPGAPRFAWISNAAGRHNVWVAVSMPAAQGFQSRQLTHYADDDGIDLSDLAFVPHRDSLLYVRGGDVENPDRPSPNPAHLTSGVEQEIWLLDLRGAPALKLGTGHAPLASPRGDRVLFLHDGGVWSVALTKGAKAAPLFKARGSLDSLRFSPDGRQLAFVSMRGDHGFVGVYGFADRSLRWIDASTSFDMDPRWSADGSRLAFLRLPSTHDEVGIGPHRTGSPWSIRVATLASGSVIEAYRAPRGAGSVFHSLSSDTQLFWCGDTLVFPAENDGWLHFYLVPAAGGEARLLTPGSFEIEYAAASPDGHSIVYAGNAGDVDRRHLWRLQPADGSLEQLTGGMGIETRPAVAAGGKVAFLRADARVPMRAAVVEAGGSMMDLAPAGLRRDYPGASFVVPESVRLAERAGIAAHGQLFLPPGGTDGARHPALIFMHGGPVRQMLVGFHDMDYYSNAYAMNQYLASRGYVVLSLNYRSGIGYGLDFREAEHEGVAGASEYNDLLSAADLLRARPDVDPARIGLWGGSYGGYMTALGLARNSDLFAAGVDLHGVHDWHRWSLAMRGNQQYYALDVPADVLATSLAASPISSVAGWRSPVLLIHGDDDRNVPFAESVRLAEALRAQGVEFSELVLPDEIHGFLRHASYLEAYVATAKFLDSKLLR